MLEKTNFLLLSLMLLAVGVYTYVYLSKTQYDVSWKLLKAPVTGNLLGIIFMILGVLGTLISIVEIVSSKRRY